LERPPERSLRVVIIDDNKDAADSLACLLSLSNYDVRVAYNGFHGLMVTQVFRPDCVLSDISMPGLDGYELAQRIRSNPALVGMKLVALSSYSDDDHVRRTREAGFDYRLTKGGEPEEVMEVLKMIEELKVLASKTQDLARQNVELAGQTKELLREVKEEVKEVKQEVKELKQEVKGLKREQQGSCSAAEHGQQSSNASSSL
jgi:response regulator RpfG family c-di-GMP phosphodiesterase